MKNKILLNAYNIFKRILSSIPSIYHNDAIYHRKIALMTSSVYKNLTAEKLSCKRKTADIIFLDLHRGVTVPVQSYGCICMAEQLT